jgi:KDO2-lipid IV(A) lauroyltransferase
VKHRLEYLLVAVIIQVVRLLPWRFVSACGTGLGTVFCALDARHRNISLENVAAAFPLKTPAEHRRLVRGVFRHFGRVLFELLKFSTLTPEAMLTRVEFDGEEHAREAFARGRGVLFFTGHFGFWEVQAIAHAAIMPSIAVLARPLDNPLLNALVERVRKATGNSVIYRRGALRRILRVLSANQGVAMLIDQHIQMPDAVMVDFFNRPAATTLALAVLAQRTGAPVIPAFALPLGPGRYKLIYEHPVDPPMEDTPEAVRDFTQRCTDVLEMYVRRHPELWLWMHRRWRVDDSDAHRERGMFPAAGRGEDLS